MKYSCYVVTNKFTNDLAMKYYDTRREEFCYSEKGGCPPFECAIYLIFGMLSHLRYLWPDLKEVRREREREREE
jgi:hypothetical protein